MSGTIHGLERKRTLLAFGQVHVGAVFVPVPRAFPKALGHDKGSMHLCVPVFVHDAAQVLLDGHVEGPPLRVPKDLARIFFVQVKETECRTELTVISAFCFILHAKVCVQIFFRFPGSAVDARQLGAALITAPIGPSDAREFKGVRINVSHRLHVRTPAQVSERAGVVETERVVCADAFDELLLEWLVFKTSKRVRTRNHLFDKGTPRTQDGAHFLFNGG